MVANVLPLNLIFFLSNQLIVQIIMETISPPTQRPVMESSMPSQRDKPTPAPTATVHTGQTAMAFSVKTKINPKIAAK